MKTKRLVAIRTAFLPPLATVLLTTGADSASAADAAAPATFYVATDGNDAWSGTLPDPNTQKTDGPFATLHRARDAIRALKKGNGLAAGGVVVEVRGGTYQQTGPLELATEDSGTKNSPIVYRARAGEEVRLTGGRAVKDWSPVVDPVVLGRLDPAAREDVRQADLKTLGIDDFGSPRGGGLELFFQDKPMTLARWPNDGFVHITGLVGGQPVDVRGTKGDRVGKFFYEGERPNRWAEEDDAWVHGYWFWDWADERHAVESIDTGKRVITLKPPYHRYGYRKGQWFYAFNLLAELDRPGEWYLDRTDGILYFWPPEPIEGNPPIVSVLDTLITVRDASHITFHGLILESARKTAVTVTGCRQVHVAACVLRNLGGWAVKISGGGECGLRDSDVYATGDGGVSLSGGDRKSLTPAAHYAANNHIHHYSRWNRMYQPAVSLSGVGNVARNNLIHHAPHEAMAFGGNDHLIELNEIHHVCRESNDAGAIYSGRDWTMRGTLIRHNFLHHITGFRDRGCVGVYLDDMFSGTIVSDNVFFDVTRAAFIGGGRDCTIENNVFIDCKPALHIDARALGWAAPCADTTMRTRLAAMPYESPLWRERYPKLPGILEDDPAAPKGNLVARNVSFGGRWDGVYAQARPYVTFQDNLTDFDPGFVDAAGMNFQLRDDSPVYTELPDFRKIPFKRIGLVPCDSPFRKDRR